MGPFILSRYCMLRGKRGKPFWFRSLGQMIQFGTIKFGRTFKNYFGHETSTKKQIIRGRVKMAHIENVYFPVLFRMIQG